MNKTIKIIALILGVLALINFFYALFMDHGIENYTIINYSVSKLTYLIYKFLIALILISAGIRKKTE